MPRLQFDATGEKVYRAGVSQCVLFPGTPKKGTAGIAWNGITNITDSPEGGESNDQYADNIKYASLRGTENFKGSIEALHFPKEFEPCMGKKAGKDGVEGYFNLQNKTPFSFAYINYVGNDTEGLEYGNELNIVWNSTVGPVEVSHDTLNDSPEATTFSWDYDATPVSISKSGFQPTSKFSIVNTEESAAIYTKIYNALYGTDEPDGTSGLLMPDDIIAILDSPAG